MIDLKDCSVFDITVKVGTKLNTLGAIYHQDGRLVAYESYDGHVLGDWVIADRERLSEVQIAYLEKKLAEAEAAKIQEQLEEGA